MENNCSSPVDGYVLGSLGFNKDLSAKFFASYDQFKKRMEFSRRHDPTPKNYNILSDLELLNSLGSVNDTGSSYPFFCLEE